MITYIEKGHWLHKEIRKQGYSIATNNGVIETSNDVAAQSIIDSFDPLPFAKADKIKELKREAAKRANLIYGFMSGEDNETEPGDVIAFYNFASDIYTAMKPAARDPLSGRLLSFKNLKDAATSAIADINAITDWQLVMAYDVVNTPSW